MFSETDQLLKSGAPLLKGSVVIMNLPIPEFPYQFSRCGWVLKFFYENKIYVNVLAFLQRHLSPSLV